jgi:hypothetical protein
MNKEIPVTTSGSKKRGLVTEVPLTARQLNERLIDDEKVKRDVAKLMEKKATKQMPAIVAIGICVIGCIWFWYVNRYSHLTLRVLLASSLVLVLSINATLEFHKGDGKPTLKAMLAVAQIGIILFSAYSTKLLDV